MNRLLAAAVFLTCAAAEARRACPTVYQDDSPETVTAAITLGIAHPPGDALVALTGRLACALPVGSPAFRLNLLAGWLLAATATGLAVAAAAGAGRPAGALAAIVLLLTHPALVRFGADAKGATYGLNLVLLLSAGTALLAGRWTAAGLLGGILAGHHWMTAACFLGPWAAATALDRPPARRAVALAAALALPGLALLLMLPIRSAAGAALDWGATRHAAGFAAHLARTAFLPTELHPAPATVVGQFVSMGRSFAAAAGVAGILLALLALRVSEPRPLRRRLALAFAVLLPPLLMALYFRIPADRAYLYDAFLLPAWLLAAAAATRGAARGAAWSAWGLVALLGVHTALQAGALRVERIDRATWSFDLGRALLRAAPPRGGLLLASDLDIFACWHARDVLGEHPGTPVIAQPLLKHPWYAAAVGWPAAGSGRRWIGPAAPGGVPVRTMRGWSWRGYFEAAGRMPEPLASLAVGYTNELIRALR